MRRVAARAALSGLIVAAVGLVGGPPAPAQAGPVVVATPAEWQAAFLDPTVSAIALAADLTIDCAQGQRAAPTAVAVDGRDHTIEIECGLVMADITSTGPLAFDDITIVGSDGGGQVLSGVIALRRTRLVMGENLTGALLFGGSSVADTTVDLATSGGTGLVSMGDDTVVIERTAITGIGSGISIGASGTVPTVVRDTSIVVSRGGVLADGPLTAERVGVRAGLSAIAIGDGGSTRVSDSTVVLDPALLDVGSPNNAIRIIAIDPKTVELDQVTVIALDVVGVTARTAIEAVGPALVLDLHATVVQARAADCVTNGNVTSSGDNVTGDDTCGLDDASDRVSGDVGLEPYDPTTGTAPPTPGGPLVDAVADCTSDSDQRGIVRPQGAACDIGAVELEVAGPPTTSTTSTVPGGGSGPAAPATPVVGPARFTG